MGANDGNAKEDEKTESITIDKMTLGKDAVGINVGRIVMTDKVPRYQFNGCTIREVMHQKC